MSHSEKGQPEIISPIKIQGKAGKGQPGLGRRNLFKFLALAFFFLLISAGGAWLLHYLAKNPVDTAGVEDSNITPASKAKQTSVEIPEDQSTEAVDLAKLAVEKENAENKLADFTLIKNELESKGASAWGGDLYAEIIQLSQEADAFFIQKNYVPASEQYTDATAGANELAGQMEEAFQLLMDDGRIALAEGAGERAQKKFSVALMIDPTNELAQHSLERAKKVETVMQWVESGKRHEKNGNLSFAHADYQEALRLDPESKEAREALNRIKGQIKNEAFQQLMFEGLAAFHNNNYELAKAKLLKANSFKPESREVRDALAQVDQAIRLARIEGLRKKALKAESSENWEQALKFHLAVLEIDQNVQFAARGKDRSFKQIQIEKRINFFLDNPKVIESDSQLGNAVLLVHEVEEIEPKGPRLKARLKELTQLVEAAQTPVKIAIESDNITEVAVYKIGKLGRFTVRELSLRPGTYTVVGARDGYKDVRQKIVIRPGQGPLRISVKCKVKI
ncbi:MAG: hypothetical protein JRJ20_08160 [Deltaproteobacteria bacterium]|nr:hypothetical protein [Deltaproteobacteria bacterium]